MVTWLTSAEASERLGVNRATLYAYVSRGLIRSSPAPGDPRARRYAAEDVERLRSRAEQRRDPQKAVERALHWGVPVLESAITLIAADRLYYRGYDACELARSKSIKQVASLIWLGGFDGEVGATDIHVVPGKSGDRRPFIARAQSMLPLVAAPGSAGARSASAPGGAERLAHSESAHRRGGWLVAARSDYRPDAVPPLGAARTRRP